MKFIRGAGIRIALALLAGVFLSAALPGTAEAKHSHRKVVRHCGSCHAPVYAECRFVGYDRCGHPVYRWVEVRHQCSHHGHHYDGGYGYNRSYGGRDPVAEIITGIMRSLAR